jgi:hypothetical protein
MKNRELIEQLQYEDPEDEVEVYVMVDDTRYVISDINSDEPGVTTLEVE